jgi:hypothetical protein
MLPFFMTPWALAGLIAIPTLAAIYWLRSRFRRVPVSSLMFWLHQREAREGGLRVQKLQTPLLFFLELLALTLLAVAAADPTASAGLAGRPLIVVLDDSYSMLAGTGDSPRQRALEALREELGTAGRYSIRFIAAGDVPQTLGDSARTPREALEILEKWTCQSPAARMEQALFLAMQLGGETAAVLVVSDRPPVFSLDKGRIRWWAFGEARANVAFVNAARNSPEGKDRCLLEVANLWAAPQDAPLRVTVKSGQVLHSSTLRLGPSETRRLVLNVPGDVPTITATLGEDVLDMDNQVTLLRESEVPVKVDVQIRDEALRALLEKALKATGRTAVTAARPDLIFTDQAEGATAGPDAWALNVLAEKDAEAFLGPFVVDHNHPLTEGLSLGGVVWGGGKTQDLPGSPVILAGNVPLLTDMEEVTGRHTLRLRLRPDLSTFQDSPQWPAFIWNLVQWRASAFAGLSRSNFRLGETAILNLPSGVDQVELTSPGNQARTVPVRDKRVVTRAAEIGRYQIRAGETTYSFAVNALSRDESDLSTCASGRWGEWTEQAGQETEDRSVAWILLLVAAVVLTVHLVVAAGTARKRAPITLVSEETAGVERP